MLLVGAANVGDDSCIGPTSVDCGALLCTHHSRVLAAPLRLVSLCWTAKQCCVTRLGCVRGVLANARCTAGQRLAGRLSVPS